MSYLNFLFRRKTFLLQWFLLLIVPSASILWVAVHFYHTEMGAEAFYLTFALAVLGLIGAGIGSFGLVYAYHQKEKGMAELSHSKQRIEGILLSVPDMIMQVDNEKRYVWANRVGLEFFGEEVIGKEASFYFEGEQDTYAVVQPLFSGDNSAVYVESWQRRRDGEKRLLAWWCQTLRDEKGQITGILSTARDITEEYKREESLSMQAEIFDAVQDSIIVHDVEGRFIYLNENAWKTRGYTHDEMMAMSIKELDAPQYREDYAERMKAAVERIRQEGSIKIEVEHLCKNGEHLPVEVYAKLIVLHNHEYVLSSVRDIRDRKEAEQKIVESEKKYRDLVEHATIGIYRTDVFGTVLYVNDALSEMLGFASPDELIGGNSLVVYKNPEERANVIQRLSEEHFFNNYEFELVDKQGIPVPVMASATLEGEIISGMIIDMREINESRKNIEKLSRAVEQIDDSVYITDKFGNISYVNDAYCRHTGYTKDEVIGKNSRISKSGMHDQGFYKHLWTTILNGEVYRNTLINRKKNGDLYYEKKTISPLKDDHQHIVGFISTGKDVTQETMLHQEVERIATIDALTGICNRHKLEEIFTLESERSRRFSHPLSVILIDIDHFKSVNDTYGHNVGDEVLKRLADVVQESIRKIDVFARWGGEEFLVLSPNTNLDNIQNLAEKLRKAVESAPFPEIGHITISLGIAAFENDDTFSELLKRADQGLYYAKEHGRNQVGVIQA